MAVVKIMQEDWDYLIILDACRYDYFEQVWQNRPAGKLEPRISIGSSTKEWRNKSFTDYYDDVIYISANPYINAVAPAKGFFARDHFFRVCDLWLDDWDKQYGTVLPQTVTKRAAEIMNSNRDKRAIIHYIQPHEPYLGTAVKVPGFAIPKAGESLSGINEKKPKFKILNKLIKTLTGVLYWLGIRGNRLPWTLRELLAMPPANPMDAVRRQYGDKVLRQAYRENVQIALKHASELADALFGRIVITSDHGEMLGEKKRYGHWSRSCEKILLEIPWLVIDKRTRGPEARTPAAKKVPDEPHETKPLDKEPDEQTKKQIQEKLKALGYFD
jgi:hypothetical protein